MSEEKFLNLNEVAERLRVTRQSVYNWVHSGKLKAVKIGREYRVSEAEVKRLLSGVKY